MSQPLDSIACVPVGRVIGGRVPAEDDEWGSVTAVIRLDARFGPEALAGLTDFSHIEVVYVFDQVPDSKVETGARRPRNNPDWPLTGVFAQRGKNRPNRIGVSRCQVLGVDGVDIEVRGLDAIDGTPVLDIKPWMKEFAPIGDVQQPQWATELMAHYYD
jgi:tRNA-Thr(GGU) m(6)t(6)A37 methyltransferase TsaA